MQQLQTQIVNASTNYIKSSLGFNTVVNYATVSAQKAILNITAQQQQLLLDQTRESLYQSFVQQPNNAVRNITVTVQGIALSAIALGASVVSSVFVLYVSFKC